MKKIIFFGVIALAGMVVLGSASGQLGKRDGTEPGHTGSPGDSLKNCTVCHGGIAITIDGWITSNIPAEGYVPGRQYTITATNTEHGATRFGFQVSPQALNGNLLGTLVVTDTTETKLVGDGKYITYRSGGVEGVNFRSWTFDWIAPAAGTGEVVFYGAFNSNENGHKAGDQTFLSTLTVKENTSTSVGTINDLVRNVVIYPNPAVHVVTVGMELQSAVELGMRITDLSGREVRSFPKEYTSGSVAKRIDVSSLQAGIYLLQLEANGKTATQKLYITR